MNVTQIRVFVPCKDYAASHAFYQQLGFQMDPAGDDLCIMSMGNNIFFLQRFYNKALAENLMLQIIVDDIDAALRVISRLTGEVRYEPIKQERWGKVIYLWGPSGELLHVTQLH